MVSRRRDRSVSSQIALSSNWKDDKVFLVENKFTAVMKTLENTNNAARGRIGLVANGASDGLVCLGARVNSTISGPELSVWADRVNRHGLANLNRRKFSDVQLEVVRLYRANGTLKEWFNPDTWISDIADQGVGR
jgi:hypothetical protein